MSIKSSFSCIGLTYFQRIELFWRVLSEGRSIALYRNWPIWADIVGGDFALSQKGLAKKIQFFGNKVVQCMKKNTEWLKIFDTFYVINASSDIVCKGPTSSKLYDNFRSPCMVA